MHERRTALIADFVRRVGGRGDLPRKLESEISAFNQQ
jgi:hypothetical protein